MDIAESDARLFQYLDKHVAVVWSAIDDDSVDCRHIKNMLEAINFFDNADFMSVKNRILGVSLATAMFEHNVEVVSFLPSNAKKVITYLESLHIEKGKNTQVHLLPDVPTKTTERITHWAKNQITTYCCIVYATGE
jgi:hypothetical protein